MAAAAPAPAAPAAAAASAESPLLAEGVDSPPNAEAADRRDPARDEPRLVLSISVVASFLLWVVAWWFTTCYGQRPLLGLAPVRQRLNAAVLHAPPVELPCSLRLSFPAALIQASSAPDHSPGTVEEATLSLESLALEALKGICSRDDSGAALLVDGTSPGSPTTGKEGAALEAHVSSASKAELASGATTVVISASSSSESKGPQGEDSKGGQYFVSVEEASLQRDGAEEGAGSSLMAGLALTGPRSAVLQWSTARGASEAQALTSRLGAEDLLLLARAAGAGAAASLMHGCTCHVERTTGAVLHEKLRAKVQDPLTEQGEGGPAASRKELLAEPSTVAKSLLPHVPVLLLHPAPTSDADSLPPCGAQEMQQGLQEIVRGAFAADVDIPVHFQTEFYAPEELPCGGSNGKAPSGPALVHSFVQAACTAASSAANAVAFAQHPAYPDPYLVLVVPPPPQFCNGEAEQALARTVPASFACGGGSSLVWRPHNRSASRGDPLLEAEGTVQQCPVASDPKLRGAVLRHLRVVLRLPALPGLVSVGAVAVPVARGLPGESGTVAAAEPAPVDLWELDAALRLRMAAWQASVHSSLSGVLTLLDSFPQMPFRQEVQGLLGRAAAHTAAARAAVGARWHQDPYGAGMAHLGAAVKEAHAASGHPSLMAPSAAPWEHHLAVYSVSV